jgi:hypothetical protein
MALLFMDSFDHYATADIAEKWTSITQNASYLTIGAYGRNGTNGLWNPNTGQTNGITATVLGGITEVIVGVALQIKTASLTLASGVIGFGTGTNWQCGIHILPDLTIQPFCVDSAGWQPGAGVQYAPAIGTPSTYALQVGVWAYLEVKMKCNATTGYCIVRVNGTEILNQTGLDTSWDGTGLTRVGIGGNGSSHFTYYFDDLVVMDTTGSLNNAFLGDVTVSALYPNGDGASHDWLLSTGTPDTGVDHDCIDEPIVNDDTDYVSTSTVNVKSTYAMQDCAAGADIRAVQILASVRKGAEGPGQIKLVTRSNSTDYDGAAQGIGGTSYAYVREVREVDPATSAAWLEAAWNAVEIGIKKTG